jgi:hypothetical protein
MCVKFGRLVFLKNVVRSRRLLRGLSGTVTWNGRRKSHSRSLQFLTIYYSHRHYITPEALTFITGVVWQLNSEPVFTESCSGFVQNHSILQLYMNSNINSSCLSTFGNHFSGNCSQQQAVAIRRIVIYRGKHIPLSKRHTDGPLPQEDSRYSFLLEAESTQGP